MPFLPHFFCLQPATVIRLDHLAERAITHRGNVPARMVWRDWHAIDVLAATSKVDRTLRHASVSSSSITLPGIAFECSFLLRNSSRYQHDDDTKRGSWAAQWRSDLWALSVIGATRWVWINFLLCSLETSINISWNIVSRLECLSSGWVNQLMLKNGFSNFPSLRYLITSPEWNFAFRNSIKIWHRKVRRR